MDLPELRCRSGAAAREPRDAGQDHLKALATDLDDDALAFTGVVAFRLPPWAVQAGRLLTNSVSIQRVWTLNGPSAGAKAGSLTTARSKGMTVGMPSTTISSRARRERCRAWVRVSAGDDQLGQHGVEVAADDVALLDAGINPDAGAGGVLQGGDGAGGGHEVAARVLAGDAELEGVAADLGVVVAQCFAAGQAELLADQVDAGDFLGDAVLHLEAGVDLKEGNGAVLAHQELTGAGTEVAGLLQDGLGGFVQPLVLLVAEERRRGFFDELLVAALQRAVAGGDHHDVAVGVGEALGFDVPGCVQEALDEAFAATEGCSGLTDGGFEEFGDFLAGAGHLDAAAAAAESSLDGHGQAEFVHELEDFLGRLHGVGGAGDQGCAHLFGDVPGLDLVAEGGDRLGGRADPGDAGVDDLGGKLGVLGQEAVAGVDGVRTGRPWRRR